jgi:hypothetical protein
MRKKVGQEAGESYRYSVFGHRRPTLFCFLYKKKKHFPLGKAKLVGDYFRKSQKTTQCAAVCLACFFFLNFHLFAMIGK